MQDLFVRASSSPKKGLEAATTLKIRGHAETLAWSRAQGQHHFSKCLRRLISAPAAASVGARPIDASTQLQLCSSHAYPGFLLLLLLLTSLVS